MAEVDDAAKQIAAVVDPDANIIFGATIDEQLVDQVKITVIATGFDETKRRLRELSSQPRYGSVAQQKPGIFTKPVTAVQPAGVVPQVAPAPLTPADDLPPEEDEFDIPAFLRQRS
ncbi:MAG: Cell division protein FtsZ [Candidatus Gottesmanbacteria bacterium GW2011_GWA2_47_9]|uniref:Cell division protein FtsZ n=1 Tax=Candidatus Gottesmanbacteria bacterium GW2011_GWA2_47_9 TaxID=1618445 RepID=A0A0G1X2P1_9BACT|nr:MAG: Cell division protein FtsZ [Candidatus Gottesmanbacteria bacterium GW2011_GWA2_47_9]